MSSRNELAESTIMIAHHERNVRSFVDDLIKDVFDDQETYSKRLQRYDAPRSGGSERSAV